MDLPRLYREIDLHFTNALADGRLKTIPTRDFADLLTKPTLPENYRPTLYDFIAHEALAFYTSGEFAAAKPEDAFEIKATDPVPIRSTNFSRGTHRPPTPPRPTSRR